MITAEKLGVILMQKRFCPGNEATAKAKILLEEINKVEKEMEVKELSKIIDEPDPVEEKIDKLIEVTLLNQSVLNNILKALEPRKKGKDV